MFAARLKSSLNFQCIENIAYGIKAVRHRRRRRVPGDSGIVNDAS